jgi:hypothetical protein
LEALYNSGEDILLEQTQPFLYFCDLWPRIWDESPTSPTILTRRKHEKRQAAANTHFGGLAFYDFNV